MAQNTIDETTALAWISAWRATPVAGIKAYFIPKDDLSDLMNDSTCIGVRAYLALGNTAKMAPEAKLLLVDVDAGGANGTDVIANGIFDFTKPCPACCDTTSPIYTLDDTGQYPVVPGNTIDIKTAVAWAKQWRLTPDLGVKAFFIPKSDIQDLLTDPNTIGVRAYLGWGTTDPAAKPEAKLMIVNVEGDISTGGTDNITTGIFDFTKPCPTNCDVTSSLYTLQP